MSHAFVKHYFYLFPTSPVRSPDLIVRGEKIFEKSSQKNLHYASKTLILYSETMRQTKKEIKMTEQRRVYFLMDSQRDENGELIVCIAVEGERGYYKTDWRWGKDIDQAEEIARKKNELMGVSDKEAHKVVLSTMRKGAIETPRF